MRESLDHLINDWDYESWVEHKKLVRDCIAIDGVLLNHERPDFVYLAPEVGYGVRFELDRADIVDALPLPVVITHFDQRFKAARILIKRDAIVRKVSVHIAASLVEYVAAVRKLARHKEARQEASAYTDASSTVGLRSDVPPQPEPTPEPTPTPEPKPAPEPPVINVRG